jgi:protein required for attachment to host cells
MVSNRHMVRWLKTVVLSDVEKAQVMRQVGDRETTAVDASRSPK